MSIAAHGKRFRKKKELLSLGEVKTCRVSVLGGYDMEEKAARAYDLAALKYWGPSTHINFPVIPHLDFCYLDSHGNFVAVTVSS